MCSLSSPDHDRLSYRSLGIRLRTLCNQNRPYSIHWSRPAARDKCTALFQVMAHYRPNHWRARRVERRALKGQFVETSSFAWRKTLAPVRISPIAAPAGRLRPVGVIIPDSSTPEANEALAGQGKIIATS
ncbi:hypothetical protein PoB_006259900 [Plakobranchus ocellatus]|uniref:Uncharacterized protein n=1 Tax=Plakobranchus ocellatus TaxID=259542 RepID=A0AAV4CW12_9GAST|nr:hypothetical protein PoB_006259900 [Plakobranchus ocellatus]